MFQVAATDIERLKNKKMFLLDMDGTIYLDDDLFDGVLEFLDYIKSVGGKYMFLTNNSSKSVTKYIEKLAKLGIRSDASDFLTSTDATALYLQKCDYKKIYAFGTSSFKAQLADSGLPITDVLENDIDCLCMGFDTELAFQKLEDACILLNRGVDYIATNPDWVCPTWYGFVPDCGSVAEMLYNATKRRPKFIGKPQPEMILLAMEYTGFSKEETIMFGDRLYTDIKSGENAGVDTVFVLSGEGTMETLKETDVKPTYIFENIKEFYETVCR
ncbi:MAG: HAD-IIA family hydrolase [Ruminococcaceae bacterium]|nr:HAD-IIA family hydrolase [Oscillospiraceae bacterium]